jgi:hypothetical protein
MQRPDALEAFICGASKLALRLDNSPPTLTPTVTATGMCQLASLFAHWNISRFHHITQFAIRACFNHIRYHKPGVPHERSRNIAYNGIILAFPDLHPHLSVKV